jgi:hypothetical protein
MVAENMVMDMLLRGRNMLFRGINVCSEKVIVDRNDFEYKRTGKNFILSRSFIGFVESSS